jgi:hypothetical protein
VRLPAVHVHATVPLALERAHGLGYQLLERVKHQLVHFLGATWEEPSDVLDLERVFDLEQLHWLGHQERDVPVLRVVVLVVEQRLLQLGEVLTSLGQQRFTVQRDGAGGAWGAA